MPKEEPSVRENDASRVREHLESPHATEAERGASQGQEAGAAAADPSGYVWDPRGYYWHPVARHWYEPYSRVYYSEDGQVLPAERAQAELAAAMGWGSKGEAALEKAREADPTSSVALEKAREEEQAAEPSAEPTAQPASEPAPQPSAEPAAQPVAQPAMSLEEPEEPAAASTGEPLGLESAGSDASASGGSVAQPLDLGMMGDSGDAFSDGPTMVGGLAYEEEAIRTSAGDDGEEGTDIQIDFGPEFSALEHPLDLGAVRSEAEHASAVSEPSQGGGSSTEAPPEPPAVEFPPDPSVMGEPLDFSGLTMAPVEEPSSIEPIAFTSGAPTEAARDGAGFSAVEEPIDLGEGEKAPALPDAGAPMDFGAEFSAAGEPINLGGGKAPALPDPGAPMDFGAEFSAVGEPIDLGGGKAPALPDPGAPMDFGAEFSAAGEPIDLSGGKAPALPETGAPVDFGAEFSAVGEPIDLGGGEKAPALPDLGAPMDFGAEFSAVGEPFDLGSGERAPALPEPGATTDFGALPSSAPAAAGLPPQPPAPRPAPQPPPGPPPLPTAPPPIPRPESTLLAPVPRGKEEAHAPKVEAPKGPPSSFSERQAIFGGPAANESPFRIDQAERAIVHLVDGQVRRGVLQPGDLFETLKIQTPEGMQTFEPRRVQIVFLLRKPTDPPPKAEGRLVQAFLPRGRTLTGYAGTEASAERGFFLRPRVADGSTSRVFLYPWAIQRLEDVS